MTPRDELINEIAMRVAQEDIPQTSIVSDIRAQAVLKLSLSIKRALRDFAARSDAQTPRSGCEIADMLAGHPPLERRKGERRKSLAEWQQFRAFKLSERDKALYPQKAVFLYRFDADRRKQNAATAQLPQTARTGGANCTPSTSAPVAAPNAETPATDGVRVATLSEELVVEAALEMFTKRQPALMRMAALRIDELERRCDAAVRHNEQLRFDIKAAEDIARHAEARVRELEAQRAAPAATDAELIHQLKAAAYVWSKHEIPAFALRVAADRIEALAKDAERLTDALKHILWIKDGGIDGTDGNGNLINYPDAERDAMYKIAQDVLSERKGV